MGKTVLISGCTNGGIGFCLADEFNRKGYNVFASARKLESMSNLPESITRVVLDVTSEDSCKKAVDHVVKASGSLDILVNNAGMAQTGALLDMPLDVIRAHMDTNVMGAVRMIQLAAPHMMSQGRGLIINIGSGLGYMNYPLTGAYTATKHALHSINDVLRLELAPLGIDVMLVAPGFINTSMVSHPDAFPVAKASAYGYDAFKHGVGLLSAWSKMFASSPQALARRVVAAASSPWGPPRHLPIGTGIWYAMLEGWLPLWARDWLHGLIFELKPTWRAAALMADARRRKAAPASAKSFQEAPLDGGKTAVASAPLVAGRAEQNGA